MDSVLIWLSTPVQSAVVWVIDGVGDVWNGYFYLVGVQDENSTLRKENRRLKQEVQRFHEIRIQNQRLQKLVRLRSRIQHQNVVTARIVGVGTSAVARTIRIDVGSNDGIKTGNTVISEDGLVGQVSAVVSGYCEVRLIVDGGNAVDVVVQRTRVRGIMRGQGKDEECILDYVFRATEVDVDDKVVTSGLGGAYPPGLPVGVISRVTSPKVGVFREVEVRPHVEFESLEEVLVLAKPDMEIPPEIPE